MDPRLQEHARELYYKQKAYAKYERNIPLTDTEAEYVQEHVKELHTDAQKTINYIRSKEIEAMSRGTGNSLPDAAEQREEYPMADGLLDYFPNALAEVARLSKVATDQHHPGEPLHWERGKSMDHRNKILRHLIDSGKVDGKGMRHSTMVAWRGLALLQEELERDCGYPMPRNAR